MKHAKLLLFFCIIFIVTNSLPAGSSSFIPDKKKLETFLKNTIETYKIPGLAIAIVNEEGVLFNAGYGQLGSGINITPETPFLLGSTTKTFTALAVMHLVEMGKVELDESVRRYLPEFQLATPEYEELITVRHLLNHTSGLTGIGMSETLGRDSLEDELLSLRHCRPVSAPGLKYAYFNTNYRILGLLIEKISGMSYGDFLDQELFNPLKMSSTFPGTIGVEGMAPGHGAIFSLPFEREQKFPEGALPSGYLVSSAHDIGLFLIDELRAINGKPSILSQETVQATWDPPGDKDEGYAMGWLAVTGSEKSNFLVHGGSLENYQSFFYINPESNIGFVFMINQGGVIPMIGGFNTIRNGLIEIINNKQPSRGTGLLPVIIVSGLFFLVLGIVVFRLIQLKKWSNKERWKRWISIAFDFLIPCFFLFWFIPIMNGIMGEKANWRIIYSMIPEIYFLLCIVIISGFFRGFFKILILYRKRRILFKRQ